MPEPNQRGQRPASRRRGRGALLIAVPLAILAGGALLLTDAAPDTGGEPGDPAPAPTIAEAVAARSLLRRLHDAAGSAEPVPVEASAAQLAAVAAVASHGLDPDRLALGLDEFGVHVSGSRRLPLGRWLNLGLDVAPGERGPLPVRMTVGSVTLPAVATGWVMKGAIRLLGARGLPVVDPDRAVRSLRIEGDRVIATVDFSGSGELADQAADVLRGGDGGVARVYCRLATLQRRQPAMQFSQLVRVAFAAPPGDDPAGHNRDTLVALAMLVVNPRVGLLAGMAPGDTGACQADATGVTIHGRNDSPKHWLMSAALAVTTGARLSQAAGEWKELADSMADSREFRPGDASGFSFADIGADRAGELIAMAAVDLARAEAVRAALARADDEALMPRELLGFGDGLDSVQFARRYGSTEDPRYRQVRDRIDAIILARTPAGR